MGEKGGGGKGGGGKEEGGGASMCASVFPLIYNWNTVHRFLTLFSNLPSHGVQMSDRAGDTAWGNAILHPSDT